MLLRKGEARTVLVCVFDEDRVDGTVFQYKAESTLYTLKDE